MAATAAPRGTRAERNARAIAKAREAHRAPATRPAPPRRKSGPVAPPSAPRQRPRQRQRQESIVVRLVHGRAAGVLDGLLRGRAWVVLVGVLLVGIVFLNVSILQLNRGIARTDAQSTVLERVNSGLRARVARLDSAERIQAVAQQHGFVMPQPGDVTYLPWNPRTNARLAAERIVPPAPQGAQTTPAPAAQPTAPAAQPITPQPATTPPAASQPAVSPTTPTTSPGP